MMITEHPIQVHSYYCGCTECTSRYILTDVDRKRHLQLSITLVLIIVICLLFPDEVACLIAYTLCVWLLLTIGIVVLEQYVITNILISHCM